MTDGPKTNIKSSVAWSFLTRWSSKGLGMLNTIILARLLSPEDFGIVAMATLFMGMLESMTQIGAHLFVFRQKEEDDRVYHSAWTVTVLQGFVIGTVLVIGAPFVADYYGKDVLVHIIYCLALVKILKGFQNYGVYIAQKKLNFRVDFQVTFYSRLAYLFSTIGFALWLENFWALIFGQLVSAVALLALSYGLHPFRPKFGLYRWRELLKFSMSTVPMSTGRFVNNQADTAVVSKVAATEYFGQYHVAFGLADLFTKGLLMPVIKGMLPNLSALQGTPQFQKLFVLVNTAAVYFFLPVGLGLSAVSPEFVAVLLGDQWTQTAPVLAWLTIYTTLMGIMMFVSEQFLIIMSEEKLSNRLMWLRNAILIAGLALILNFYDFTMIPKGVAIIAMVTLPIILIFVCRKLDMPLFAFIRNWWPAVLAALVMWASITHGVWPQWHPMLLLPLKVAFGGLVYVTVIAVTYLLRGRPEETPESLLLEKLKARKPAAE